MSHFRDAFCVFSRDYSDENVFSVQVSKSLSYERFSIRRLVLKLRHKVTRKWQPTVIIFYIFYSAVLVNWVMIARILVRNSWEEKTTAIRNWWKVNTGESPCLSYYSMYSNCFQRNSIDRFKVVGLVTWRHCFCCVNQVVLMLTSRHLHNKSRVYQSKVTSSLACHHGQVTKHTTVKWPIVKNRYD